MKKFILFIWLLLFYGFHDFHMTHTTLYYNYNSNIIEITTKVAIEDLERTLENQNTEKLRIGTDNESIKINNLIESYYNSHVDIKINNKDIEYKYIGKEVDKNLHDMYLYFEINNTEKAEDIKSITIENTLFLEIASNQTNIVLIEINNQNFNLLFTKDLGSQTIMIKN